LSLYKELYHLGRNIFRRLEACLDNVLYSHLKLLLRNRTSWTVWEERTCWFMLLMEWC